MGDSKGFYEIEEPPPGIKPDDWERMRVWEQWAIRPLNDRDGKTINFADLKRLSMFMVTDAEAAAFFNMDEDTFRRRKLDDPRIEQILRKGRETGKASLRRRQYLKAMEGDTAMLKHLGEQYLGQSKKIEQTGDSYNSKDLEAAMKRALERMNESQGLIEANAIDVTIDANAIEYTSVKNTER